MTLGVYNPAAINNLRAFGASNASFGGTVTTVYISSQTWDTTGLSLGFYRVQARWNTTDAVGFVDTTFELRDPDPPITLLSHNGTLNNITMNTKFNFTATDPGTGVNYTNITIQRVGSLISQSRIYLPGNRTFSFLNRSIVAAGLYNVSWYSVDNNVSPGPNVEIVTPSNWMVVNLTRPTSITLVHLRQTAYGLLDTGSPYNIYYGKNTTARIRFIDDLLSPITAPDFLNVTVNAQLLTSYTVVSPGIFDFNLNTSKLDTGSYIITIAGFEANYNVNRTTMGVTIDPVAVQLTVVSRSQDGVPLVLSAGLYEGLVSKNFTIVIGVQNVLNNEWVLFTGGSLNITYSTDEGIIYTTVVGDADDSTLDGRYTVLIDSQLLVEKAAYLNYTWSDTSTTQNYINSTKGSFLVKFKSVIFAIKWNQLIILIVLLVAIPIIYTSVMKKVIVPRRQERHNFLAKISSAFEDAANIQNVLVIHKASGTCLFFKSYGKTAVDPDLITGFLTAIQSFGAEMSGNKAMEELTWQDYQLVLGEGELIRVALVLASKASMILKTLVPQFVAKYEATYADKLRNWRGDLTSFRDSIKLINEVFDTSIILPHKRSDLPIKPRTPLARQIYDLAGVLTRERDYFFIATLLSESIEKTKRSYGEIIAAIQELREDEILVHIDIESLEKKKEMTQQEVVSLQQRVAQISFLNPDEKAKLLQDLMRMSANEREASLSSMMIMTQLQSATTQSIHGGGAPQAASGGAVTSRVSVASASIQTKKAAQSQIKSLDKNAKICLKNFQYEEAIKGYEQAEIIASQWDLKEDLVELTHKKIDATTRDYQYRQAVVIAEAKNAEKGSDVATAIHKYQEAANYSSALFKLGISTEDKKMREFIKKAEQLKKGSA
jgi:hypothetical protein